MAWTPSACMQSRSRRTRACISSSVNMPGGFSPFLIRSTSGSDDIPIIKPSSDLPAIMDRPGSAKGTAVPPPSFLPASARLAGKTPAAGAEVFEVLLAVAEALVQRAAQVLAHLQAGGFTVAVQ